MNHIVRFPEVWPAWGPPTITPAAKLPVSTSAPADSSGRELQDLPGCSHCCHVSLKRIKGEQKMCGFAYIREDRRLVSKQTQTFLLPSLSHVALIRDALSPSLFALAIEPLAIALKSSPSVSGILRGGMVHRVSLLRLCRVLILFQTLILDVGIAKHHSNAHIRDKAANGRTHLNQTPCAHVTSEGAYWHLNIIDRVLKRTTPHTDKTNPKHNGSLTRTAPCPLYKRRFKADAVTPVAESGSQSPETRGWIVSHPFCIRPAGEVLRRCLISTMGKDECKTMLDALNKVTACYRHLVIALGSTSDSQNLREELKRTRKKAQELAVANRTKLTSLLKDKSISKEDRAEYERLWVLFSSSMELLEVDMKRSLEIGQDFPLKVPTRHLIQTGMTGSTTAVAARAMSVQNMKYEADSNIDTADLRDLQAEISQVTQMMEEMEMKVQVAPWAVEAKQEAGAELKSNMSVGNSSVGVISICEEEPKEEEGGGSRDTGFASTCAVVIFLVIVTVAVVLGYLVINMS
ncbi:hypothetical protein FQN60_010754 [Etheostoma spectabile]|uniref:Regulator of G protein signaling 9 binding protein n=2 Tax=Etheostoma spectabile TaxID=54343 RepID=A0A5J5DQH4_9PERO|nr:hypothetical protein FQN60_010754 [Etheostoma spectabile]